MRGATRRGEDQSRRQAARVLTRGAAAVEKTIGIEVRRGGEARTAVIRGAARGAAATRGVEATKNHTRLCVGVVENQHYAQLGPTFSVSSVF